LDAHNDGQWGGDSGVGDESNLRYLGTDVSDDFATDGLYNLDVVLRNRIRVSAWFIVTRGMATTDPEIVSPGNQPLTIEPEGADKNPRNVLFKLSNFTSDRFRTFESKHLSLSLALHFNQRPGGGADIRPFWQSDNADLPSLVDPTDPKMLAFRAGDGSMPLLDPGEYRFTPNFQETRSFGPLELSRDTMTVIRFFASDKTN
jgi:hypothetical protein